MCNNALARTSNVMHFGLHCLFFGSSTMEVIFGVLWRHHRQFRVNLNVACVSIGVDPVTTDMILMRSVRQQQTPVTTGSVSIAPRQRQGKTFCLGHNA